MQNNVSIERILNNIFRILQLVSMYILYFYRPRLTNEFDFTIYYIFMIVLFINICNFDIIIQLSCVIILIYCFPYICIFIDYLIDCGYNIFTGFISEYIKKYFMNNSKT